MKSTPFNCGSHIRNHRERKNMPLRYLVANLNIDTSSLAKLEKGKRSISLNIAPMIAKALKLDFKELQITLLASLISESMEMKNMSKKV